jgi:hypothetical protein
VIPRPLLGPLVATAALAGGAVAWWLAAAAGGASKTGAIAAGDPDGRLDVAITLDFPPEAFHVTRAQELGQLVRVDGRTLYLTGVPRRAALSFARHYWVADVQPWRSGS